MVDFWPIYQGRRGFFLPKGHLWFQAPEILLHPEVRETSRLSRLFFFHGEEEKRLGSGDLGQGSLKEMSILPDHLKHVAFSTPK